MKQAQDAFGQPLLLNHYVAYTVRSGSSMDIRIAKVFGFEYDKFDYQPWKIEVIAAKYEYDYTTRQYITKAYRTKLSANHTLINLGYSVPKREQDAIEQWYADNGF